MNTRLHQKINLRKMVRAGIERKVFREPYHINLPEGVCQIFWLTKPCLVELNNIRRARAHVSCQTRACIERLDDVVLFFSDQEITWSGVVYVYLLGTDHLISDVRLFTPLLAPCI